MVRAGGGGGGAAEQARSADASARGTGRMGTRTVLISGGEGKRPVGGVGDRKRDAGSGTYRIPASRGRERVSGRGLEVHVAAVGVAAAARAALLLVLRALGDERFGGEHEAG